MLMCKALNLLDLNLIKILNMNLIYTFLKIVHIHTKQNKSTKIDLDSKEKKLLFTKFLNESPRIFSFLSCEK